MTPIHNRHGERLDYSYHPGEGSSSHADHLLILAHGVTGNKDRPLLVALAEFLAAHGWPCLRLSFSGNGKSDGEFSDSNISKEIDDLSAVIDQWGAGKKIGYIGHSMGAAVGTLTAARDERVRLMVNLAGMVHTANFVQREFGELTPDQALMWDEPGCPLSSSYVNDLNEIHSTLDAVKELRLPWLLIHGLADDVVLPEDSQDLYQKLRSPRELVEIPGADHSFEGFHDQVRQNVVGWLEKHF